MEDVLKAALNPDSAESKALISYIKGKTKKTISVDQRKLGLSGFSSGGNLALNSAISLPDWPSIIPSDHPHPIVLLLFYPSFDARQLPSERARPANYPVSKQFWSKLNDTLTPTYLPREHSGQLRASPGLANASKYLHKNTKAFLLLTEVDTLAEQSQICKSSLLVHVITAARRIDLLTGVKHIHDVSRADDVVVRTAPFKVEFIAALVVLLLISDLPQHGYTQMPDKFLGPKELESKYVEYKAAAAFAREHWSSIA